METQRLNNPTPNDQLVETCDTLKSLLNRLQAQQLEMDELFENYNEIDDDWRNERIKAPTQDMLIIEQQESFKIELISNSDWSMKWGSDLKTKISLKNIWESLLLT